MKKSKLSLVLVIVLVISMLLIACSHSAGDKDIESSDNLTDDQSSDASTDGNDDSASSGDMSETMKKIKDEGKIILGTNAEFPPFEMRSGEKAIGVDIEISQAIADKLGVELVIEDMDFDGLISALNAKSIDFIAAGYTVDPERGEQVLYTDTYFKAVQRIMVKDGNTEITNVDDLIDKSVGVQTSTTGDYLTDDIIGEDGEVVHYKSHMEAAIDLKSGRLDAVIVDDLPGEIIVSQNEGLKLLEGKASDDEEYAMAVRKEATDLQELIDEVLAELKENGQIDDWVEEYSFLQ